ncbi:hypothetical protein [Streptomyces reniochalinae]|uniref:hypothetical protein n=1 Tax=Streptomyces reniochalinae TaxID=2250578 RepID=UPI0011C0278C|nr:hypothetical protein [Streptomyces reniochalinae]
MAAQGCTYLVDGLPVVSLSGNWVKKGDEVEPSTPFEVIESYGARNTSREYAGRYDVATWSAGAVAAVDCPRPEGDLQVDFTRFLLDVHANDTPLTDDPDRSRKVFGDLAQSAMTEVASEFHCEGQ